MKENRNIKKTAFHLIFLVAVFTLTCYGLFKDEELSDISKHLAMAKSSYLLVGVILVVLFVSSESLIIFYMMRKLGRKVSIVSCIKYSFIGFFFSCITPSASGGQPAQIYYMKKDKIDMAISTLVLMIVTVAYKFVLVLIGMIIMLVGKDFILSFMQDKSIFLYLGLVLNIICVIFMLVLIFEPTLAKRLMVNGLTLLQHLHIIKNKNKRMEKLELSMDQYHEAAKFFKEHKFVIFNVVLISIFQRICLFYVTYLIYRSFGLHGYHAISIIALQAVISISVDMLPLPGGMGASEHLFLVIFEPIFGSTYVLSGMLLSRGISYYTLLLLCAIVTCYAHFTIGKKS